MRKFLIGLSILISALLMPSLAHADPEDIAAASRSVVRVVVFPASGGNIPIGHGSGIVVTPNRVLTNAHVVSDEEYDGAIRLVIVPSDGGQAISAEVVDRSPRNDLALVALSDGNRLPPATFFSGPSAMAPMCITDCHREAETAKAHRG